MLPVYTNYLTPAEYGIVGLLALFLSIYELFLGARFGVAIPKFFYDQNDTCYRRTLISTALTFTISASCLGALIFALTAEHLAISFFERSDLSNVFAVYGVMLITSSIESYGLIYLRLRKKPFYFFILSVLKLALQLSLNIYFLIELEMGVVGVIYSGLIASLILAGILGFHTFSYAGISFNQQIAKRLWEFSWPLWLSGFATLYITFITNFVLKYFTSLTEVGLYHFAMKFAMLISLLFWEPFNQWWQVQRFEVASQKENPQKIFSAAFIVILSVLCCALMGVSLFSGTVIDIMASESFAQSKQLIPLLCLSAVFNSLKIFVRFSLLKSGLTKLIPKITFMTAINITISCSLGTLYFGLIGAICALVMAQILEFFVTYAVGRKAYDMGLPIVLSISTPTITVGFVMATLYSVELAGSNILMQIAYLTLASALFCSALLGYFWLFSPHRKDLTQFVKLGGN